MAKEHKALEKKQSLAKKIANAVGLKGRKVEGGEEKPAVYGRHYNGGGMEGHQLVTPKHVFSLTSNKSGSNGDVHGLKFSHKKRTETNL